MPSFKRRRNVQGRLLRHYLEHGLNAATIHYSPIAENLAVINPTAVLRHGRAVQRRHHRRDANDEIRPPRALGEARVSLLKISARMLQSYTRVLQGHIALARAVFPTGTPRDHAGRFGEAAALEGRA